MTHLLFLLVLAFLSACGSSPASVGSGPYSRIETYAGTGAAG